MKFRWDKKYLYWGLVAFLVIISSISFFLALFRIDEVSKIVGSWIAIIQPILYGLVIAYLLIPIMNFFEKNVLRILNKGNKIKLHKKIKSRLNKGKIARTIAILITMIITFLVLLGVFNMVIPEVVNSIMGIVDNFDTYASRIQEWAARTMEDNPELEKNFLKLYDRFSDYLENWLKDVLLPQVDNVVTGVTSSVLSVFITIKDVLIGVIISVYVMASKDIFSAQAKKMLFATMKPNTVNHLIRTARKTHKVFGGFISGKLLDSLIIGILCLFCLNLLNMPYALLVSVIIGITNIIPFFGPFIGAVPSGFLILLVDPVKCIYFVIFIILLQQFDGNILGPKILGDSTGLSSFWVMFAILVSGGLFGFIGMIIGVPFFAVIYSLISEAIQKSLDEKNLPIETEDYKNLDYIDKDTKDMVHFKK